ncbi:MAG: DoxX family protein [Actinomycetota bacterium]|uniref:DoxX family protein n=1 Tax=Mycobacterium lentiflavum TaxID=141349 RepID=A0ABY3URG5_MYCLN|nr:DoxX family protein [Mycobacterium lentiflavum]MEE3066676.1 DoxX family protein [Actinomycetota bacterium]ULP42182.2 DoxX family protein [Mycobacterium lentiflavum]
MHTATVVLSVVLALEFAFTGFIKVLGTATARANAAHLDISEGASRLIGAAELAAVAGLLAGVAVKSLTVVTAAGLVALMIGAIGYHLKARDTGAAVAPAVITGLASTALLVLAIAS